jgi:hypothetical protein
VTGLVDFLMIVDGWWLMIFGFGLGLVERM